MAWFLAKGAGEGTPPFWIIAIALVVIVGVAFLMSKARKRQHHPRDTWDTWRAPPGWSLPAGRGVDRAVSPTAGSGTRRPRGIAGDGVRQDIR